MPPNPLVTRNQIELMEIDSVTSTEAPGFKEVGISPRSVEEIFQDALKER
jgi:NADH dehydrogenase